MLVNKLKPIFVILIFFTASLRLEYATASDIDDAQKIMNEINLKVHQGNGGEEDEVQKILDHAESLSSEENSQKNYFVEAKNTSEIAAKAHEGKEFKNTATWIKKNQKTFTAKPTGAIIASSAQRDAVSTILRNYSAKADDIKSQKISYHPIMIFASASLPRESLKNLMFQAKSVGAVLVFRGLIGKGLKDTVKFLAAINRENVSAIIDPRLFEIFAVTEVPTFIVMSQSSQDCIDGDCMMTPKHDRMVGNVTLDYVLETMSIGRGDAQETALTHIRILENKKGGRT